MLLGILTGPGRNDVQRQIEKGRSFVDGFEWRLDYFSKEVFPHLASLQEISALPSVFTLRPSCQGGEWQGSEEEHKRAVEELLLLEPTYFDLAAESSVEWLQRIFMHYDKTHFILSHHNYLCTPSSLSQILDGMQKIPAYAYKIAVKANSTIDALRVLCWIRQKAHHCRISGIALGVYGQPARVLGPVVGNSFDYASIEKDLSLEKIGVMPAEELQRCYGYKQLSRATAIYALIGNPVAYSPSHIVHNRVMQEMGWRAIYVKFLIKEEELTDFFHYAKDLPFQGLSVTMPLKQGVLSYATAVEEVVQRSGALNTLIANRGVWQGANTDGKAAVFLIEQKEALARKRCIIVGAGGTGRAIAYEALKRGAHVILVNRTLEKARLFTEQCGGEAYPLSSLSQILSQGYDILINATSVGFALAKQETLIREQDLWPGTLVMEVVARPKHTPLTQAAEKRGCRVIYGEELFAEQAARQFQLFRSPSVFSRERQRTGG